MEQKYSTIKQTNESDQIKKEVKKDYRFFLNNNEKNKIYKHKDNTITQTKYNIITFLPKALLFQFFRLANVYFLIIAIIQLIPQISPLSPSTAIAPLAFVLCISLIREAIEDYNRYKFDKQLNTEPAYRYNNKWENINSGQLSIGELIIVTENNPFPADMIVLDSNLNDGQCFIETGTLDGEKNLKNKNAPKSTAGIFGNDNANPDHKTWKEDFMVDGECYGAMPNMELYKFDGFVTMNFSDGKIKKELSFVLDAKQMLLKGKFIYYN
jgi:magnesium-transporting ATPase (P-type)